MRRLVLPFLLVFAVFAIGTATGSVFVFSAWASGRDTYLAWDTLTRAFHAVRGHYVEEVDEDVLIRAALDGLAGALDPHTVYLDPDEWARAREEESDRYHGIGVRVIRVADGLEVTEVIPGSPAARQGLATGDLILALDGQPLADLADPDLDGLFLGERGTSMTLRVRREDSVQDLVVVRDLVFVPATWAELVAPGVACVALAHFHEGASDELREALGRLRAENGASLEGIVLDLRDNPGGLLREAVAVADLFLEEGVVVATRGRGPHHQEVHHSTTSESDEVARLVVLVDGRSASAAELVAGALQARGRATLVGSPTFGKGSVQSVWTFEDGSAMKLTVSRYELPDGRLIDPQVGVVPDVLVPSPEEQRVLELTRRFQAEVEALEGIRPADRQRLRASFRDAARVLPDPDRPRVQDAPVSDRLPTDPQLARALELAGFTPR